MKPILFWLIYAIAAAPDESRMLNSFESNAEVTALHRNNVRLEVVADGATEGRRALRVDFAEGEWPNVQWIGAKPEDWSGFEALALDVRNPGPEPVEFSIRVDDDPLADGVKNCRTGSGRLSAGESVCAVLPLTEQTDPMKFGMRGLPPAAAGLRVLSTYGNTRLELKHIVAWQLFMNRPKQPASIILDNVRLIQWKPALDGIVDEFGQYAKADWPGKLNNVTEFATRRAAEEADLKAHPTLPDRDQYGGYTKAAAQKATGFFRTEKINGKWWLVTPEGHVFFSTGMDCINLSHDTVITGREAMFTWLPHEGDPLARHAGRADNIIRGPVKRGQTFNFFDCNLERKFGHDCEQAYYDEAVERLRSWGFNTVANWSDQRLYAHARVPYTATAGVWGGHKRLSAGEDYWGEMHDPYDPAFRTDAAAAIRSLASRVKDDPWCVGWFVDNELSWGGWGDDKARYGLALSALAGGAACPAKKALVERLKTKYEKIERLNEAWCTKFGDWAALQKPYKPSDALSGALKTDVADFAKELARQYFRVIREELRQADPNHLYLGCRFAWHTPEAVTASAEICDVVSINMYAPRLDLDKFLPAKTLDKPCMIGEFHFGALDRGMFHTGLVSTPDQKARAAMYIDYLRSVADHPNFVGCHWFQYVDEPLTGRSYDGENYEIGFVNVTDTPYPEMVEAARAVHGETYARRWR